MFHWLPLPCRRSGFISWTPIVILHVWDPAKGAAVRDLNLEKAMAKLTAIHQFVVTTVDGTLFAFDNDKGFGMAYDIAHNTLGMPSAFAATVRRQHASRWPHATGPFERPTLSAN